MNNEKDLGADAAAVVNAGSSEHAGTASESVEVTITRTVNKCVHGYDAEFWYESYRLVRDAVLDHLEDCVHDDDVAEEAIIIEAIKEAGERLKAGTGNQASSTEIGSVPSAAQKEN